MNQLSFTFFNQTVNTVKTTLLSESNCMAERVGFEPTVVLQRHAISSRAQSATLASLLGGEGGIRTHDEIAPIPVFETGALIRSATSPAAFQNYIMG